LKKVDTNLLSRLESYLVSKVGASETVSAVPMSVWSAPEDFPDRELTLIMPKKYKNSSHYLICTWLIALSKKEIMWKEELRLIILQKCKENKYQSEWMTLFHLVKLDSLQLCLYILLESYMSADDIWGNVIKHINLIIDRNLVRFAMIQRKKPKEKVFRRGYNDKGSRRPAHVVPICLKPVVSSIPEKLDLSDLVKKKNRTLNFLYS